MKTRFIPLLIFSCLLLSVRSTQGMAQLRLGHDFILEISKFVAETLVADINKYKDNVPEIKLNSPTKLIDYSVDIYNAKFDEIVYHDNEFVIDYSPAKQIYNLKLSKNHFSYY